MKKVLGIAMMAAALAVVVSAKAEAVTIIAFGQSVGGDTIFGVANGAGTQTTITGTNVPVLITFIENGSSGTSAFLNLSATSFGTATLSGAGNVVQEYSGSFTITSLAGGGGTNYLSGTYTDATFGVNGGTGLTMLAVQPPGTLTLTSSVITSLGLARDISLSFTNVTPAVHITGTTLGSFSAGVSGDASANIAFVPEPGSMLLLGTGLLGMAAIARRRVARKS